MFRFGEGQLIAILGGSGFVGRALVQEVAASGRRCRILVHRSRPDWLVDAPGEVRSVDVESEADLRDAMAGCGVVVNLLRPDGGGRHTAVTRRLAAAFPKDDGARYLHASSIDVYGAAPDRLVGEDTRPWPITPYEREQGEAEEAAAAVPGDVGILRFGAVFGTGGRSLITLARHMRKAPHWQLALRRAVYGHRRLHLVGVDIAVRAVLHLASDPRPLAGCRFLVTEDRDPDNEFAAVQEIFMAAFGRPSMQHVPLLPPAVLRFALTARGRSNRDPQRRYSDAVLAARGFVPGRPLAAAVRALAETWAAESRP